MWLDPVIADLGLTSMARGRHALATGELVTKTRAIEEAHAPVWLIEQTPDPGALHNHHSDHHMW